MDPNYLTNHDLTAGRINYLPPAIPRLVAVCGRDEQALAAMAQRYGYETIYSDWREMLADERIQLFDNVGPYGATFDDS